MNTLYFPLLICPNCSIPFQNGDIALVLVVKLTVEQAKLVLKFAFEGQQSTPSKLFSQLINGVQETVLGFAEGEDIKYYIKQPILGPFPLLRFNTMCMDAKESLTPFLIDLTHIEPNHTP